ncbi:MAG: putative acyl-CoA transferase/carnitine dehydratase [Marmoricola sp.]|nr:putative acyl-CoA transferase/carnitine dehydratase [Marmoricola sp.]
MSPEELDRPLEGVRVVDLMTGPMAATGRLLAEWGADVVRVEPRGGSPDRRSGVRVGDVSLDFVAANLGKRAVALDLTDPSQREVLDEMLATADVLLENNPPGSSADVTLDVDSIVVRRPGLVVLSATPFGRSGSYRDWQATGPVYHALSGVLSRSGIPGRPPLLPPGDLAHDCAVPQAVYVVLLALLERRRSGQGDHLDFSILDGAVQALDPGYGIAGSATAGVPASKLPRGRPDSRHMYPIVPCADGHVRLCVLAPRQWRGMFAWMGSPAEFADPSYEQLGTRFSSPTLIPAIGRFFADQTRAELEEAGQRYGVPTAALLDLDEALLSEQALARRSFVPVAVTADLDAPLPAGVVEIDGCRAGPRSCAPELSPVLAWSPRDEAPEVATSNLSGDRPLSGLRVLDLGVIVVGAEHGRLMADQGADVVKVENDAFPDGSRQTRDGSLLSVTFAAGHRNKRSIGIDLRSERGKQLFLQLVEQADVVMSNFRPGTLDSLGFGNDVLRTVNPRLVAVESSAFGSTGPWSTRLGYGPLVRASAGLTKQWSYPDEDDGFCDSITVYPDHVAARIGAAAALALLLRRQRTGRGGTVSVSQSEVMLSHSASVIAAASLGRGGHDISGAGTTDAPWAVFPTAGDDDWCVVTVRGDADWRALCCAMEDDDLAADTTLADAAGRSNDRQRVEARVADWLVQRTAAEAMETLQQHGVPAASMLRVSELPTFGYHEERRSFRNASHPLIRQSFFLENAPVHSGHLPDPPDRPAPVMGQHNGEVIEEWLGLGADEIAHLQTDGTLRATSGGHPHTKKEIA